MSDTPLHFRTLTRLASEIRAGTVSPVELTEALLARIEQLNGSLNAFNLVTAGRAPAEADVLRAGYAYEQACDWRERRPELSWAVQGSLTAQPR